VIAPVEILSPGKRAALIACLKGAGTLYNRHGVLVSQVAGAEAKPIVEINSRRPEPSWHVDGYRPWKKCLSATYRSGKLVCSNSGSQNRIRAKTMNVVVAFRAPAADR